MGTLNRAQSLTDTWVVLVDRGRRCWERSVVVNCTLRLWSVGVFRLSSETSLAGELHAVAQLRQPEAATRYYEPVSLFFSLWCGSFISYDSTSIWLDSTAVRLPFDCSSIALRLFDDLRCDRGPGTFCMWAAALRPK